MLFSLFRRAEALPKAFKILSAKADGTAVTAKAVDETIERIRAVVKQWRKIAGRLGLTARDCDQMAPAFSRCR